MRRTVTIYIDDKTMKTLYGKPFFAALTHIDNFLVIGRCWGLWSRRAENKAYDIASSHYYNTADYQYPA